jgi:hypothetical protein
MRALNASLTAALTVSNLGRWGVMVAQFGWPPLAAPGAPGASAVNAEQARAQRPGGRDEGAAAAVGVQGAQQQPVEAIEQE